MIDACCSILLLMLAMPFKETYLQYFILLFRPKSNVLDGEQNVEGDDANLAFLGFLSE